jgi:hypothetical protein
VATFLLTFLRLGRERGAGDRSFLKGRSSAIEAGRLERLEALWRKNNSWFNPIEIISASAHYAA